MPLCLPCADDSVEFCAWACLPVAFVLPCADADDLDSVDVTPLSLWHAGCGDCYCDPVSEHAARRRTRKRDEKETEREKEKELGTRAAARAEERYSEDRVETSD